MLLSPFAATILLFLWHLPLFSLRRSGVSAGLVPRFYVIWTSAQRPYFFFLCPPCCNSDFAGGKAHQGISQSAVRMWTAVKGEVEKLLREHSDYKLVLTGDCGIACLLYILLDGMGLLLLVFVLCAFRKEGCQFLADESRRSQATATTSAQVGVYGGRRTTNILCVLLVRCCQNGG